MLTITHFLNVSIVIPQRFDQSTVVGLQMKSPADLVLFDDVIGTGLSPNEFYIYGIVCRQSWGHGNGKVPWWCRILRSCVLLELIYFDTQMIFQKNLLSFN